MDVPKSDANLTAFLLHWYNSTSSGDAELYAMFHGHGQTPVLIVPAVCLALIGFVGIPLNAFIVYTTVKNRKQLSSNTNFLIALNAFFDLLQLLHPFPFLLVALSGLNFIGTLFSLQLILLPIFGIQCSLTCIACTGVDRLLSVLLPFHYDVMCKSLGQRRSYCAFFALICVANGIWNDWGLWLKCAPVADLTTNIMCFLTPK